MSRSSQLAAALGLGILMTAAGVAGLGAQATVATPSSEDEAKLRQCLEAVRLAESDARACIGVVADPCLERPGESSTQSMIACIDREAQLWDRMVTDRFGTLMSRIDGAVEQQVRDVHEAWIDYRDKRCALGEALFPGGSLAPVWAADCLLQETGRRAIELGALLDEMAQQ